MKCGKAAGVDHLPGFQMKELLIIPEMAFVILQNILKWHSSKKPTGGTNLWVGFGGLHVRCEDQGGSHQFQ